MSWWTKVRDWFLGEVEEEAYRAIDKMDKWEPKLADIIRERLNPDEKATQLVTWLQDELHKMVDKISGKSWITKWLVKGQLHAMVDMLDRYEDDLADLMRKHVDADKKSKLVVDYMQDWLRKQVAKVFD